MLVADGVAPEVAAEETVIAMTSDNAEVQDTVRRVVRMIFVGATSKEQPENEKSAAPSEPKEVYEEPIAPKVIEKPRYAAPASDNGDSDFSFGGSDL